MIAEADLHACRNLQTLVRSRNIHCFEKIKIQGKLFPISFALLEAWNCISVAAASTKSINFYLESLLIWPTITFGFWRAKKEIKHEKKRENRKTCNLILQHVSLILFMENNNKKIFRREVENIALRVLTLWKRSLILVSSPCS